MSERNWDRGKILALLPQQGEWFRISNQADSDTADIYIYNEISYFGVTADDFIREASALQVSTINLHLNSKGGDVFDGIAIYNALRSHPAKVIVRVDSLAASIASVIAQAGDERVMVQHSQMMIHDAYAPAVGNAGDFREFADLLDKQSDLIASIYAERSSDQRSRSKFRGLMKEETWLSDAETVDLGLADRIEKPKAATGEQVSVPASGPEDEDIAASLDWSRMFENVPDESELILS